MSVPWGDLLRAALRAGIRPDAFWRLSLREWRWIAAGEPGLGRSGLASLLAAYPDTEAPPGRANHTSGA